MYLVSTILSSGRENLKKAIEQTISAKFLNDTTLCLYIGHRSEIRGSSQSFFIEVLIS
jgi:hypothetical protein